MYDKLLHKNACIKMYSQICNIRLDLLLVQRVLVRVEEQKKENSERKNHLLIFSKLYNTFIIIVRDLSQTVIFSPM